SGGFLIVIGIVNLAILLDIVRVYRRMRRGQYNRESLDHELMTGGVMTRLFGRLFRLIDHSWQMYPIGFLFGLGFDTAPEVRLLDLHGAVFEAIAGFDFIGSAGYVIVAAFVIAWGGAFAIYKVRRIDERWGAAVDKVA